MADDQTPVGDPGQTDLRDQIASDILDHAEVISGPALAAATDAVLARVAPLLAEVEALRAERDDADARHERAHHLAQQWREVAATIERERDQARAEIIDITRALHQVLDIEDPASLLPHWRALVDRVREVADGGVHAQAQIDRLSAEVAALRSRLDFHDPDSPATATDPNAADVLFRTVLGARAGELHHPAAARAADCGRPCRQDPRLPRCPACPYRPAPDGGPDPDPGPGTPR